MKTAVWITTYGQPAYSELAILATARTVSVETHLGLIDNGSCTADWDQITDAMVRSGREWEIVRRSQSLGLTASWREAVDRSHAFANVVLLNNDVIPATGWLEHLTVGVAPGVGLVGPVTNQPGHSPYQRASLYAPQMQATHDDWTRVEQVAESLRTAPETVALPKLNGFGFLVTREAIDRVGNFDPKCHTLGAEDEYQGRCMAAGLTMVLCPRSYMFHFKDVTLGRRNERGLPRLFRRDKPASGRGRRVVRRRKR